MTIPAHLIREYVAYRIAKQIENDDALTEEGALFVAFAMCEPHGTDKPANCDVCGWFGWQAGRHYVKLPAGKGRTIKLIPVCCENCGNTKLISAKTYMQNERIRIENALLDGDETHLKIYQTWFDATHKRTPPE